MMSNLSARGEEPQAAVPQPKSVPAQIRAHLESALDLIDQNDGSKEAAVYIQTALDSLPPED